MGKTRNSTWLSEETDLKLNRVTGRCIAELGRERGRGGGWRGKVIDAALALVSEDAILAILKAETEQRKAA